MRTRTIETFGLDPAESRRMVFGPRVGAVVLPPESSILAIEDTVEVEPKTHYRVAERAARFEGSNELELGLAA